MFSRKGFSGLIGRVVQYSRQRFSTVQLRTRARSFSSFRPIALENYSKQILKTSTIPFIRAVVKTLHTMILESEVFKSIFTPELQELRRLFGKHGYEIRLAGGPVRDLLMNIQPTDLDFATTATPEQMKKMFDEEGVRMINLTGEKHGTITARINDKENFEITTLRIDVVNHGRHADVEFIQDWKLDAERRDLTINSMFLDFEGTIYDYCGGWPDLQKRRVAFVGDAATRIQEDYLRILRYFRFCAKISPEPIVHEAKTLKAIRHNIDGLSRISGERIWIELKKILSSKQAGPLMSTMLELGVAPHIGLPAELNSEEFDEVWRRAHENQIQLQPASLLAALLYSQEEAITLRDRIKYPNFDRDLSFFIIQHRDVIPDPTKPLRPYHLMVVDNKNKQKDALLWTVELLRYQGRVDLASELESWVPPKFPVGGNDLKDAGVPGGKSMNIVMQRLRDLWKDAYFQISKDELLTSIPNVMEELSIKSVKN